MLDESLSSDKVPERIDEVKRHAGERPAALLRHRDRPMSAQASGHGPRAAWRDLGVLLSQYRGRLALGFALMVVNRLSAFVLPASSKVIVDGVTGGAGAELLTLVGAVVGLATIIQAGSGFALAQVLGVTAQRAIADLRKAVHLHVLHLPLRHLDSTKTGVLVSRIMTDADGIKSLVATGIVELVGGLLTTAIGLGVLLYLNWRLTLVTIAVLGAFGGAMTFAFTRLRPLYYQRNRAQADVSGRLAETLGGIRIVKSYTAEAREHAVFTEGVERLFAIIRRDLLASHATSSLSVVLVGLVAVVMMVLGGRAVIAGTMTLGDLAMYTIFIMVLNSPVVQIALVVTQLTEAFAGLDRIREIRSLATEDDEDASRLPLPTVRGDVVFDAVTFEYAPGAPVLKAVSFVARQGSTTALVGPSGAGKSTLIGLVMAFNRPTGGRILVDGLDLAAVRLRDYRQQLGAVLQEGFLFDGTIADNIAFSKPGATLDEIRRVSRIAHCDEFIDRFERGYDTIVGERGVRLSGGQQQRLAIARAVLLDPRILVLDEATSSLDSESEALIQDGLQALRAGRTTFVIAHRLSTIMSADQILVMDHGEVVEQGTHQVLHDAGGLYRQLYDRQYRAALERFTNPGEEMEPA